MIMNLESPSSTKSPTPYLTTPGLRTPGITTSATAFTFNLENVPTAPSLSANVNVTSFPLLSPALDEVLANIEASDLQTAANKSKNLTKSSSTESLPTVKSNNNDHDPNNNELSKNFNNSEFTGTKRSSVHFDTNSALFPKIKQSRQRGIDNSEGYHSMFGSISSSTTTSRLNSNMGRSIRSNVFEAETPSSVMTDMNNCMLSKLEDPFSTSTEKSKQLTRSQTINHELGQNPNQNKIMNKFRFESHGEISSDSSSKNNINSKFSFVPPSKKSDKKEKLTVAQRRNIKLPSFDIKSKSLNGLARDNLSRPTDNNNNTNGRLQLPNKTKISSPEGGSTSSESRSGTYIVNHSLTSSTISSGNDENFNYLQSGSNNNSVNSNLGSSLNSEVGGNNNSNKNNCTTSSPLQVKGKGLSHMKSLVWAGTFLFILGYDTSIPGLTLKSCVNIIFSGFLWSKN